MRNLTASMAKGKSCRRVRVKGQGNRCMCPTRKGGMRFAKKNRC